MQASAFPQIKEKLITLNNTTFLLNNQRSLYIPTTQQLVLADLHLGKTSHFQQHGIALPSSVAERDLAVLEALIKHYLPNTIIIAGDFFHAHQNSELNLFKKWKNQSFIKPLEWILVKGNHDRMPKKVYQNLNIELCEILEEDSFRVVHHPPKNTNKLTLSGHLHPGIVLKGIGKQRYRLPCFLVSKNEIILPAFSHFTGLDTSQTKNYTAYIIGEDFIESYRRDG